MFGAVTGPGEPLGDHMWPIKDSNPRISQRAREMGAEQWLTILSLRAKEMRKGGMFIINHMGEWGGQWLMQEAFKYEHLPTPSPRMQCECIALTFRF